MINRAPRAVFLSAWLCATALVARSSMGAEGARLHKEGKYFEVAIPPGWTPEEQSFGLSPDEKKIYGVTLAGPYTESVVEARMSAHYCAPDNLMDKTPEKYIRVHSYSADKSGVGVSSGTVGGLPAKRFENVSFRLIPPRSLNAKKIGIRESFAVIPLKRGYYALRYTAAAEDFAAGLPAFEAFLSSFKPLLK